VPRILAACSVLGFVLGSVLGFVLGLVLPACASTPAAPPPARCGGFDFPVGPPDADGYYDAQPFGTNLHLGSDYNGNGGGDSDLGDPVHAVARGKVVLAEDLGGGWGNVVRIVHACETGPMESLYAHLDALHVAPGMWIDRGMTLGTIGTAHGQYLAHLHFELRDVVGLPVGGGYDEAASDGESGWVDPTAFIRAHRP
jgi:murein DD-endopeptidase MepM/ murein hydrolase activator NlpD